MPLDPDALEAWSFDEVVQSYSDRDTMLYALSIGIGADPLDEAQLRFVYERDLVAVPSMAAVLCHLGAWIGDPRTGATRSRIVHGEQRMTFHRPLPPAGTLCGRARVLGVEDKGAEKGALVHTERVLSDAATGEAVATVLQTSFCRADGGFGRSFGPAQALHPIPERPADLEVALPTLPHAALLYRLNVDRNPLHADPALARKAGFPRPILHGLCTYGIAAHAVLRGLLGYDAARLHALDTRFSAAVFPGETITVELWRDGGVASFRAWVRERGAKVLDNGRALLD
jgi:acyl dehydratase